MSEGTMDDRAAESDAAAEEEQLRTMLRRAGPRRPAEDDDLEALRGVALGAWRTRYGAHARVGSRLPRALPWLAAAALLLVAATLVLRGPRREPVPPTPAALARAATVVASVERVDGEVTLGEDGGSGSRRIAAGAEVTVGATLETAADGRLALRAEGRSVRLDRGSRVRFEGVSRLFVERGAVYVDSPRGGAAPALVVATVWGEFHEVGTQFEVRAEPAADLAARLRVREGSVEFRGRGRDSRAGSGEELALTADGSVRRAAVPVHGAEWEWVVASAPPLAIEGVTARRFLDWVARESGLALEFADARAEAAAGSAVLHGSIAGIALVEAPAAVLPACGLAHEIAGGRLRVSLRTAS
jgi:hypothetical protein